MNVVTKGNKNCKTLNAYAINTLKNMKSKDDIVSIYLDKYRVRVRFLEKNVIKIIIGENLSLSIGNASAIKHLSGFECATIYKDIFYIDDNSVIIIDEYPKNVSVDIIDVNKFIDSYDIVHCEDCNEKNDINELLNYSKRLDDVINLNKEEVNYNTSSDIYEMGVDAYFERKIKKYIEQTVTKLDNEVLNDLKMLINNYDYDKGKK